MNLRNKTVLFLGSSVTHGSCAGGVSFVEVMARERGLIPIKEAVPGTTLADINETSYVYRLKQVDTKQKVDLCICQLSTNDAWNTALDLSLTKEAIRFVISYVKETFHCPVVFYTGTYFESDRYAEMVEFLLALQKECEFGVIDLYHDEEMRAVSKEVYQEYMADPIHPSLKGYEEWWAPKFIAFCDQLPE